ncbi:MAG: hypothetical protein Q9159_007583 [Coniocarpon cinnabarinum]
MHGVKPGDVLRLTRATSLGSRDFTLLGGAQANVNEHTATPSTPIASHQSPDPNLIIGNTSGLNTTPYPASSTDAAGATAGLKKKGPPVYLDDRLFICRAIVMGTESEPLRIKEKTKRRQRHVKRVKSKHRYTVVRVRELGVRNLEELEGEAGRGEEAEA